MSVTADVGLALLNGVTWGITLALVALGLSLVFGLLEIVNVSHGALYMLGAVAGWFVVDATGSFLLAVLLAPLVVGAAGVAVERTVLRPVEGDVPATVIATFGLVLVFQHLALVVFGPSTETVATPVPGTVTLAGITYPTYRFVIAGTSVAAIVLLYLFLQRTRYGMWMRGVEQDRETASALGVPTSRVYMLTFGLGAYFAALAGVLLSPIVGVNHLMGTEILAIAFVVVIVGGLGSLRGVLVVSVAFAVMENLGGIVLDATPARILTLAVLVLVVLVRPEGLFPTGGRT
jgi:branched-chain amino acid transport system permease protein